MQQHNQGTKFGTENKLKNQDGIETRVGTSLKKEQEDSDNNETPNNINVKRLKYRRLSTSSLENRMYLRQRATVSLFFRIKITNR